jgi:hypothetical protein
VTDRVQLMQCSAVQGSEELIGELVSQRTAVDVVMRCCC